MYQEKIQLHKRQERFRQYPNNLRTVALDITSKCNLHCPHCYASPFTNKVSDIDLDTLKQTLDEFYELGVFHYVLQGGEPFFDFDRLKAIIPMCHPSETYLNVISNGWLVNREKVRELKNLQVDKITFSLDSGISCEHDASRGRGSYRRVLEALDIVQEEGLLAGLSTVVTHTSLYSDGFQQSLDLAKKKQVRLHIQIAEPVGQWEGRKDILITQEDARYLKKLAEILPKLNNGQSLIHRDLYQTHGDYCPAGKNFLSLNADGKLFPCNFLQFSMGDIRKENVKQMRTNLLKSSWFSNEHPKCLCGEDEKFINTFIMPYVGTPKPLDSKIFTPKKE